MKKKSTRLYFIDAIRAWAILMMLQGHFIDGLLGNAFRDNSNIVYLLWKYFRGITAPVFFTVSGFIFTYLLIRVPETGFDNPRVKKGIKRGFELLAIGYLLRLNLGGLFLGEVYDSLFLVDVLHCIGLSLLLIIGAYLLTKSKNSTPFAVLLVSITVLLFIFEPIYASYNFNTLPTFFANYLTQANGSVFTIIPWVGYTTFGAFMALLFYKYNSKQQLYHWAIRLSVLTGLFLIFVSSEVFILLSEFTGVQLFEAISLNNYLFIRLGDVLMAFSLFMLLRKWVTNSTFLKIGQSTLSIYIIHFIILYGTFTGLGLYHYFHHSLSPLVVILGALLFMAICAFAALRYEQHKNAIKVGLKNKALIVYSTIEPFLKIVLSKAKFVLLKLFGLVKN